MTVVFLPDHVWGISNIQNLISSRLCSYECGESNDNDNDDAANENDDDNDDIDDDNNDYDDDVDNNKLSS